MAWALARTNAFSHHARDVFSALGTEALEPSFATVVIRGIFAGWLIALMVWLLPFAEAARVHVIILITYVIGIGHLSHVVAGSVTVFTTAFAGHVSWGHAVSGFVLPSFIGNVLGGVTLVAALNHAQVVAGKE